jgi:mono/diheme cytochrome c family protein
MPRSVLPLAAAAVAIVAGLGWAAWLAFGGGRPAVGDVRLRPDDAALVATGAQVYAAHCAACHGAKLEGQPNWRERDATGRLPAPPHDPSGHTWHHADAQLFAIVKHGVAKAAGMPDYASNMPAYDGQLSDAQIVAVLSWIKAQWPADIRAKHDQINARVAASSR